VHEGGGSLSTLYHNRSALTDFRPTA
jgi:hypothetical protein